MVVWWRPRAEILGEDEDKVFERDSATDDTRVRTAIAWLEESQLLTREQNFVQVFPSSLRINSLDEAKQRLLKADITIEYRKQLLCIAEALINADADAGLSTDELMAASGLSPEAVRAAMYDLERLGIASNDTALTAFVHTGVASSSMKRFTEAVELETALISYMREAAPDFGKGDSSVLHLRIAAQTLRDQGLDEPLPERLFRIVRSMAYDGRSEDDGAVGSVTVRKLDSESALVTLQREWSALERVANDRREAASLLLEHLLDRLPQKSRGVDLLAETTLGKLLQVIVSDIDMKSRIRHPNKLLDRALLWLHDQEVIRLNKGLAVFRPAMNIRLEPRGRPRGYTNVDFKSLALHYEGQILQIHVMAEFAERGLADMRDARRLAMDYFVLTEDEFINRWLTNRGKEVRRQTTPASWRTIVESLKNPIQQRIVADEREQTNVLVLAGPGSGKTRVLVHRIAWLIRVRRENARSILALAYNRHAAIDIRRRLDDLIGKDACGVTVLTCHALAMRLAGFSFTSQLERPNDEMFKTVMRDATALLRGEELSPEEADERRERLLAGFRWILVDEYQDVGREQYELISALAGRSLDEDAGKLTLFAVGDDDQNIYAFNGASVEFIRRFESDYRAQLVYLTDNYRSTKNIVTAANAIIDPARNRMKAEHPIRVDRAREKDLAGGEWTQLDPISRGKVQILPAGPDSLHQARTVMMEFMRLAKLTENWDWSRCAVISREWEYLVPVRAFCEACDIPVQMANEEIPRFWRLRETQAFVRWLRKQEPPIINGAFLSDRVDTLPSGPWHDLLRQAVSEHQLETGGGECYVNQFIEWFAEWSREIRQRQQGLLLLTAHRAKGLEFDHVAVLDGGWNRNGSNEDSDAPRRLYYVATTRARQTLTLARFERSKGIYDVLLENPSTIRREMIDVPPLSRTVEYRYVQPTLQEIDLGYAGRRHADDAIHRAIAALSVGDALDVKLSQDGRWLLADCAGHTVGRLAKSFKPPPGMRCRSAEVVAIVDWNREMSDPRFHEQLKCDSWETVVPELVFEPHQ